MSTLDRNNPYLLDALLTEQDRLIRELIKANEVIARIGDYAHDHSTGPSVPDALWKIRNMAYGAIGHMAYQATPDDPNVESMVSPETGEQP